MKPAASPFRSSGPSGSLRRVVGREHQGAWAGLALLACLLAAFAAVSRQSYWIDEANAVWRAAEPDFGRFLARMAEDTGSDAQMPLFLGALWLWEKAFGPGEWAMRAMNLAFLVPGILIFAGGRTERLLAVSVSGFVWFYLDEARPYGMQIGASLMIFGLLERAVLASRRADVPLLRRHEAWLLALALVLLAGSTLLGAIFAAAAAAIGVWAVPWTPARLRKSHLLAPGLALALIMGPLAGYYLWTLLQGAGGTRVASTDLRNLAFAAYELLGLAGLGPGRTELREAGTGALLPYLLPLATLALGGFAVLGAGMREATHRIDRRLLLAVAAPLLAALLLIFVAGWFLHWRVLGRHVAPLLPVLLAVQAAGIAALWRRGAGRAVALAFLVLSLASAASLRLAPRHAKDDYAAAASIAAEALQAGGRVWWNADPFGAMLYGVAMGDGCDGARLVSDPDPGIPAAAPAPAVIIASKPDIYDPEGRLAAILAQGGYREAGRLMAFAVWESTDPDLGRCPRGP